MSLRLGMLSLLLEFMLGCAHPPVKDPAYQETLHTLCTAPVACRPQIPATVSVEPQLEGEHAIDFYVQAALQRNPAILAAERHVAAQAEVVPQVTSLPDPRLDDIVWPSANQTIQTAAGRVMNTLLL